MTEQTLTSKILFFNVAAPQYGLIVLLIIFCLTALLSLSSAVSSFTLGFVWSLITVAAIFVVKKIKQK